MRLLIGLALLFTLSASVATATGIPDPLGPPPGLQVGSDYQRVFVTSGGNSISQRGFEDRGGLTGADYAVTFAAFQGGLFADWDADAVLWHSILSDSKTNARDHVEILGPVYNMHNDLIATGYADLWDGSIANPIRYDEFGNSAVAGTRVWTATLSDGTRDNLNSAGDWLNPNGIGRYGAALQSDGHWLNSGLMTANNSARLYGVSPAYTVPAPGDANYDGIVDGADYVAWADHFLHSSARDPDWYFIPWGWQAGDFNLDGIVDGTDYVRWADNFAPAQGSLAAVPEPSTLGLASYSLLLSILFAVGRRR